MILGLTISQFTALHVAISLVALMSGIAAMVAFAAGRSGVAGLTGTFLLTTSATSATGFLFPFGGLTPAFVTGLVSVPVLIAAFVARYSYRMRGRASAVFAVSGSFALYLNVLAFVTQAFLKVPPLKALAPTGTELPFLAAQLAALAAMVLLGVCAVRSARAA